MVHKTLLCNYSKAVGCKVNAPKLTPFPHPSTEYVEVKIKDESSFTLGLGGKKVPLRMCFIMATQEVCDEMTSLTDFEPQTESHLKCSLIKKSKTILTTVS